MAVEFLPASFERISVGGVGTEFNNLTALSVSVWVRPIVSSTTLDILGKWDYPSDKGFLLYRSNSSTKWNWEVAYNDTNNSDVVSSTGATVQDTWVHIAAVWTPTYRAIYLDGSVEGSDTTSRTDISDTTASLVIAGQHGTTVNTFNGQIYAPAIHFGLWSPEQIAALAGGVSVLEVQPDALLIPLENAGAAYTRDWGPSRYVTTVSGTPTTFRNPPVAPLIRPRRWFMPTPAVASGEYDTIPAHVARGVTQQRLRRM